jgi:hypothetical protein
MMLAFRNHQLKRVFSSCQISHHQMSIATSKQSLHSSIYKNKSLFRLLSSNSFPGATESLKVEVTKTSKAAVVKDTKLGSKCGPDQSTSAETDEDEMEEMFIMGPAGVEWGGPTRGGARPEPTRYGDWERKGRASDF